MTYCEITNGNFWFQVHLYGVNPDGIKLTYHTRIGGDGWGEVKFSKDDNAVIIDGTNFPIPPQFLEESKILGKRKALEENDSTTEKIDTKLQQKNRKT